MRYVDIFSRRHVLQELVKLKEGQLLSLWYGRPSGYSPQDSVRIDGGEAVISCKVDQPCRTLSFGLVSRICSQQTRLELSAIFDTPYSGGRIYVSDHIGLETVDGYRYVTLLPTAHGASLFECGYSMSGQVETQPLWERLTDMVRTGKGRRRLRRYLRRSLGNCQQVFSCHFCGRGLTEVTDLYVEFFKRGTDRHLNCMLDGRQVRVPAWDFSAPSLLKALELHVIGRRDLARFRCTRSVNTREGTRMIRLGKPIPVKTEDISDELLSRLEPGLTVDRLRKRMAGMDIWSPLSGKDGGWSGRSIPGLVALVPVHFQAQTSALVRSGLAHERTFTDTGRLRRRKRPAFRPRRRSRHLAWCARLPGLLRSVL